MLLISVNLLLEDKVSQCPVTISAQSQKKGDYNTEIEWEALDVNRASDKKSNQFKTETYTYPNTIFSILNGIRLLLSK